MSTDQAVMAQAIHEDTLLAKRNVVGVGVGYKNKQGESSGDVAVVVLVEQKLPLAALAVDDLVPRELEGMKTDVLEVGILRAQQAANPRSRFRPTIPCGVSIGHYKITAGTFGVVVKDRTTGEKFILSNNHVLANSNDSLKGDPILQPGPTDGGVNPGDIVANLERFIQLRYIGDPDVPPTPNPVPTPSPTPTPTPTPTNQCDIVSLFVALANAIAQLVGSQQRVTTTSSQALAAAPMTSTGTITAAQTTPENRVDCALAKPINPAMLTGEILNIGTITGTKPAALGMRLRKYGRTTEYTEGAITLINATVNVGYSTAAGPRSARFVGQVITEPMSKGGDSGSLMVDIAEPKAVGLLFAGSDQATIFTPIDAVLDALNVTF